MNRPSWLTYALQRYLKRLIMKLWWPTYTLQRVFEMMIVRVVVANLCPNNDISKNLSQSYVGRITNRQAYLNVLMIWLCLLTFAKLMQF